MSHQKSYQTLLQCEAVNKACVGWVNHTIKCMHPQPCNFRTRDSDPDPVELGRESFQGSGGRGVCEWASLHMGSSYVSTSYLWNPIIKESKQESNVKRKSGRIEYYWSSRILFCSLGGITFLKGRNLSFSLTKVNMTFQKSIRLLLKGLLRKKEKKIKKLIALSKSSFFFFSSSKWFSTIKKEKIG